MTTVAQIEKYRTTHKILGVFAMITFALSVASILYLTLESVVIGAVLLIGAIILKVFESKAALKEKMEFESGLEKVIKEFLIAKGYHNGSKVKPRSRRKFKYFINVYEPMYTGDLEEEIIKYAKSTGTKIKFMVRQLTIHDLLREIFS